MVFGLIIFEINVLLPALIIVLCTLSSKAKSGFRFFEAQTQLKSAPA